MTKSKIKRIVITKDGVLIWIMGTKDAALRKAERILGTDCELRIVESTRGGYIIACQKECGVLRLRKFCEYEIRVGGSTIHELLEV